MQRIGLEPEGRKYTPHVTLARLRDSSSRQVAEYLAARGYFRTSPFRVSRFVLFSSRASVGGGPYVVEASYPLNSNRHSGARTARIPRMRIRYAGSRSSARPAHVEDRLAVDWPCASAIASRISDSGVERGGSTSPTTLPKSNAESASNLRASCCMR